MEMPSALVRTLGEDMGEPPLTFGEVWLDGVCATELLIRRRESGGLCRCSTHRRQRGAAWPTCTAGRARCAQRKPSTAPGGGGCCCATSCALGLARSYSSVMF